jgi:hypothetical protein
MLTSKLKLGGAVVIQPLTHEQVDTHLANQGPRLAAARALVNRDPVLRELAQTPLILSLIAQTFDNETIGQDTTLATAETWRQRLFSGYVHKMLGRRGARAPYGEQDTIRWLVFMARKMQEHNVSVFALENLQKTWLASRQQIILHEWIVAVVGGVMTSLLSFGILINLAPSLFKMLYLLVLVLIYTLYYWVEKSVEPIESFEVIGWSWSSFLDGIQAKFILSCVLASIVGAASTIFTGDSAKGLAVFVYVLIMAALFCGMTGALRPQKMIDSSARSNHSIHQSIKVIAANLILTSLLFSVFGAFASILINSCFLSLGLVLLHGSPLGVIVGTGLFFGFMGLTYVWFFTNPHIMILGHLSLRFILASGSLAPLNLVRFLDFCDERLILKRAGGSYVFFHRLLLDYFAALPVLLSRDCRLDHAAEEIATRKRRLLVPINRVNNHYNLALVFLCQGDLPQASHHFRDSLGLRPKDGLGAYVHLGVLAWQARQAESARQVFEAALRVYDSSKRSGSLSASICLELRSCALLGLGRVEEAESTLCQALACWSANDGLPLDDQMWRLLQSCEHPPQGIDRLKALLSTP